MSLAEPFQFNRANPAEYSLVELKTMKEVGGPEKLKDWKVTGERHMYAPERLQRISKMRELENERLRKLGLETSDDSLSQLPHLMQRASAAGGT